MSLESLPDVLTIMEAAAVLRIGRQTAYRMAKTKVLPTVSLGKRVLVPKSALIAMLHTAVSTGVGA